MQLWLACETAGVSSLASGLTCFSSVQRKGCPLSNSLQTVAHIGAFQSILFVSWVQQIAGTFPWGGTFPLGGLVGDGQRLEVLASLEPAETQRLRNHQCYIIDMWSGYR